MSYIQSRNWNRWRRRCRNLAYELEAISKGIDATDIAQSREIAELSHLAGAFKYLRFAERELLGGYKATLHFNNTQEEK